MAGTLAKEFVSVLLFLALVGGVAWAAAGILLRRPALLRLPAPARAVILTAAGVGLLCVIWGLAVEPYRLTVREVALSSPKVAGEPLRLAHISDLHVRRWGRLEEQLLSRLRELRPDLILMSGDYVAHPGSPEDARRLLRALAAIAPAFGVRGNMDHGLGIPERIRIQGLRWLINETAGLTVKGARVSVSGADPEEDTRLLALGNRRDPAEFRIGITHYPDLVPDLKNLPFDLLLAGHTHGGQVRLPWIGALVSLSRAGTRFAYGLFQAGGRAAYVTAGVGTESLGLPPVRFLCPPEVVLITIARP